MDPHSTAARKRKKNRPSTIINGNKGKQAVVQDMN
jgi:hypothetical protein